MAEQLTAHFGSQIILIDIESIEPGRDFVEAIEDAVSSCKFLLAAIGRQWLTCANEHGRRLDDPHDFVRLEIAAALKRDIRVIPVLGRRLEEYAGNLPSYFGKLGRLAVEMVFEEGYERL